MVKRPPASTKAEDLADKLRAAITAWSRCDDINEDLGDHSTNANMGLVRLKVACSYDPAELVDIDITKLSYSVLQDLRDIVLLSVSNDYMTALRAIRDNATDLLCVLDPLASEDN